MTWWPASLPTRERGLKPAGRHRPAPRSLPTRERGLKRLSEGAASVAPLVAPHAGARIETGTDALFLGWRSVAPHAGARIETLNVTPVLSSPRGGLKRLTSSGGRSPRGSAVETPKKKKPGIWLGRL